MSSAAVGSANLLVQATLESLLANYPNRRDAKARTDRLLAAALIECAEKGYSNTTVAGIAKRAKVSTASLYASYKDRDALLVAAMELLFAIMAGDVIEVPVVADPVARVEQLLLAHGEVYAQPLTAWLCRLHATLAMSGYPHLRGIGLQIFQGIDAFWRQFLADLVAQGHLAALDLDIAIPLLLGPVERCTIIAALGCGGNEDGRPALAAVARHSAQMLFRLWDPAAPPSPVMTGASATEALLDEAAASSLGPTGRLEEELRRQPLRQTPEGQKDRIVLAAAAAAGSQSYSAISVQALAALARVSTATIYKHFRDKADLFTHALEGEFARQTRPLAQGALQAADPDSTAAIYSLAAQALHADWAWMHHLMMASELSGSSRVAAVARQHRQITEAHLAAVIAARPGGDALSAAQTALIVNYALGSVERTGLLALILFGEGEVNRRRLAVQASVVSATLDVLIAAKTP